MNCVHALEVRYGPSCKLEDRAGGAVRSGAPIHSASDLTARERQVARQSLLGRILGTATSPRPR